MLRLLDLLLWMVGCALTLHYVGYNSSAVIIIICFGAANFMAYASNWFED
jgi:hypothetical protein